MGGLGELVPPNSLKRGASEAQRSIKPDSVFCTRFVSGGTRLMSGGAGFISGGAGFISGGTRFTANAPVTTAKADCTGNRMPFHRITHYSITNYRRFRASLGRIWGLFYRRFMVRVFFCELPVREQP
ncbi:MAG: hypothetical protein LBD13_04810 [Spirochaetaceae bacterium]|nr:hypothetical protein [Spirochaetaceae bacterium]